MIRNATDRRPRSIQGNPVHAVDGELGSITDVFFDDHAWTVRYLVVYLEGGLDGQEALITPGSVSDADRQSRSLYVDTNRERVREAPHIGANLPVAARQEAVYHEYLGTDPYWIQDPAPVAPVQPIQPPGIEPGEGAARAGGDPHLRSAQEVVGYHVETADGSVGHVEDLLLDDEAWRVRYIVVDTRNWLPAKKVLVPPDCVSGMEWSLQRILVDLNSQEIKDAPAWDPDAPMDRRYETRLHEHYGQAPYWVYE